MSRKQFRYWSEYIRGIRDALWLGQWAIELSHEPTEDDEHAASIEIWYGRQRCTIKLHKDFMVFNPEDQRHAIVHELLHVTLADTQNLHLDFSDALQRTIDDIGPLLFAQMSKRTHEHLVDKMAVVMTGFFPLPDPPKRKAKKQ